MTSERLSLGEGDTPVLQLGATALRCGIAEVWAKAEWINPTGSYKDRIAAATIGAAIWLGARGWLGTSSGNGGAATSAYDARAGLPGFLCVTADARPEKIRPIAPYGAALPLMVERGTTEWTGSHDWHASSSSNWPSLPTDTTPTAGPAQRQPPKSWSTRART